MDSHAQMNNTLFSLLAFALSCSDTSRPNQSQFVASIDQAKATPGLDSVLQL